MIGNTLMSIGGLLFAVLLIFVYFMKAKQANIDNKIFKWSIILLVLVLVTELLAVNVIYHFPQNPILGDIAAWVNWIVTLSWISVVCAYLVTLGRFDKEGDFREYAKVDKKLKAIVVISVIVLIGSFFLKFDNVVSENAAYISGPILYYLYIVGVLAVITSILVAFRNRQNLPKVKMVPLLIGIGETVFSMILQLCYPEILMITGSFVFKMYLLYFMFENPDLYLIKELEKSKKRAEESNSAKTDFLSNMSHEIKQPMNAILGFSEGILNDETIGVDVAKKDIEHIYSAGSNLLEIINNILDISKIETGEEKVEEKEYNLGNIVLELASIIESRMDKEKVRLITEVDPNIPRGLLGDKTKVFQILLNILSNSVKYTEIGKIELKVTATRKDKKAYLHFKISDTGYGIKKEDFDKLFEKFARLESATRNEIEGTGLGLVITKRLVSLLGGSITFDSTYGAGTTFYVDLMQPITNQEELGDIFVNKTNHKDRNFLNCSQYKILLVDDNKLNLKVAERVLQPYQFSITSLSSGEECVDHIKAGEVYDIIFLDHMMPGMDGIEVLHILHKLDGYTIPPIVALTANAITGMREMYLEEGFDEYLSKPINTSELDKIIQKYFG